MRKGIYLFLTVLIVACVDDEGNPCVYSPTLTTSAVANVTETSATLNGVISIVSENCDNPTNTEQGFVYATTIQPTINNIQVNVNGTTITTILENLEPNTTYYARAFLTNDFGDFYGNEVNFLTSEGDNNAPVIELLGDAIVTVIQNTTYIDAGAIATDLEDGDLTFNIVTSGEVDTNIEGIYTIVYSVSDAAGNTAASSRQVTVFEYVDGENCPFNNNSNNNFSFSSQEEVDSFGSNNYTKINASLSINSSNTFSSPVTNLDALKCLTHITGDLQIILNDELTSIEGLKNLETVEGSTYISLNSSLTSLIGLEKLTNIGVDLGIGGFSVVDFTPLSSITSIGGSLYLDSLDTALDFNGLQNLTSIGGDLWIGHPDYRNESLISLNGLENLTSVDGEIKITDNPSLINYCGLESLINNLINNGIIFDYFVENNLYNPTIQDIIDGNCSL